jgi:FixJ family two-component response regulator
LDSCGYEVSDVSGGKETLDSIAANALNLIVLDWRLPGMDGIQTCRALRAYSDLPVIIVLTAMPDGLFGIAITLVTIMRQQKQRGYEIWNANNASTCPDCFLNR